MPKYDPRRRIIHKSKHLPLCGIIYESPFVNTIGFRNIKNVSNNKNGNKKYNCNNNKATITPPSSNSLISDNTESDFNSNEITKRKFRKNKTLNDVEDDSSISGISLSTENIMEHIFVNEDKILNKSKKSYQSAKQGLTNSKSFNDTRRNPKHSNKCQMNDSNHLNSKAIVKESNSARLFDNLKRRKNDELLVNYEKNCMELCKLKLKYNQLTIENDTLKRMSESLKSDINNLQQENSSVKTRNETLASKNLENQNLARIINNLNQQIKEMSHEIEASQTSNSDKALRVIELEKQVRELNDKSSLSLVEIGYLKGQLEKKENEIKQLMQSQKHDVNKDLHLRLIQNELVELKGNIRVICRIKPESNSLITIIDNETIQLPMIKSKNCHIYNLNRVILPNSNQIDVFNEVKQLILSFVDGYNVSIITYGQSGTGKTYTMIGNTQEPGILSHSVREVFTLCQQRSSWKYQVCLSVLEIYNEIIYDLLATIKNVNDNSKISGNKANWRKRTYIHDDGKSIHIKGLSEIEINNEEEFMCYISKCIKLRSTSDTNNNSNSSRSHFIVLLRIYGRNLCDTCTTQGVLMLCDLAGSENCSSIKVSSCLAESKYILKSLSVLGRVFEALYNRQSPIIPFRDSKLTHILKPSLTGEAKFALIVTVSGLMENLSSTSRTLNLAKKVAQISLGQPKQNQQNSNSNADVYI